MADLKPLPKKGMEELGVDPDGHFFFKRPDRFVAPEAMAAATAKGAGTMLVQGEERAETLRRAVMSPNGTTECAVATLQEGGFERLVAEAMDAAAARDREMGEELAG